MQQHTPKAAAVGVELGTSTATVLISSGDQEPEVRRMEGSPGVDAVLGQVRADRKETPAAPVGLAVPSSWDPARRRELADAAAQAGLGEAVVVSRPKAAAVYFTEALGREVQTGTVLVVYSLGSSSCEVGIVKSEGDRLTVEMASSTDEVGGFEFDQLLLAYLSGRHRDTDPGFWERVDDPGDADDEALRSRLLDAIRRARELLSEAPGADIAPVAGLELRLTRQELESCVGELVEQTVDLAAAALGEAGVETGRVAGIVLTGGASRTPLVAARLRERIGLDPVLPDFPELVPAEGARLVALAAGGAGVHGAMRLWTGRRVAVLAAVLAPLMIAAVTVFGSDLGTGRSPEATTAESSAAPDEEPAPETDAPSDGHGGGGGEGAAPPVELRTPEPDDDPTGGTPPAPEPVEDDPTADEEDREESVTAGTVPEVTGVSSQEARRTLADAGFTDVEFQGEQEPLFGPWYDECEVIDQDPAAGQQHAFDEKVTITYSYGDSDPEACETP
ncbi:Hsp70 family protein [Glycomyces sp. L485]|uniref:Hsp70 family protein n=1 Tax=Glycomyces sp. L485 TaxID=2909235 RepID=UPI001F4B95B1|nr:Hsp70 family protein [Glycomyces sp. L485]MCH7229736.1 Hsp70 family protein [Glycomyces sp. L485]